MLLDRRPQCRCRDRCHEAHAGPRIEDCFRRFGKDLPKSFNLATAAARHDRDDLLRLDTQLRTRSRHVDDFGRLVCAWMAHEHRLDIVLRVQRRLEGKDAEHQVRRFANGLDATRPPRPDRRTDEMRGLYAGLAKLLFQPEIEVRRVDTDNDVRRRLGPAPRQVPTQPQQAWNMGQRFDQAHDGQGLGRLPALAACLDHRRTGNALEACIGTARPDGPDQARAEDVTGCLASDEPDSHRRLSARQAALGSAQ